MAIQPPSNDSLEMDSDETMISAYPLHQVFPSCSTCLGSIVGHLRDMVAERDRTGVGRLLMATLRDVFAINYAALHRFVVHKERRFIVTLADITDETIRVRDAYLISPQHGVTLDEHPRLRRCVDSGATLTEFSAGQHVCVLPLLRKEHIHLLVEMERATAFTASDIALAQAVVGFLNDHLMLIDYAETDTLTGLLNRKTFDEHLDRVLASASVDVAGEGVARHPLRRCPGIAATSNWIAIIDIDHFKRINDTHGHLIGDEVLLLLAQLMRDTFRLDDQLFRFGGEEFIVVLQPTNHANALVVMERFRKCIEANEFPIVGSITVSIGFTAVALGDNPPELIDRADKALYFAKEHGRNRTENYEALLAAGAVGGALERQASDVELF